MGDDYPGGKLEKIVGDLSALTVLEAVQLAKLLEAKRISARSEGEGPRAAMPTECDPTDSTTWADDPIIEDDDALIRIVLAASQISIDENAGGYTFSDKAYSVFGSGVSVELERLYKLGPTTAEKQVADNPKAVGALRITAGAVRGVSVKVGKDKHGNDILDHLKVCYTPAQEVRNEYHCDIFHNPKPSGGALRALADRSEIAIPFDQQKAAELHSKKRSLG